MRDVKKNSRLSTYSCKSVLFAVKGQCHMLCSQQGTGKNKTLMSVRTKVWLLVLGFLSDKQGFAGAVYPLLHGQNFETKMGILFRAFILCRLALSTFQWWDTCPALSFSCCPWNLSSQILAQVSHRLNQLFDGSLYPLEKVRDYYLDKHSLFSGCILVGIN